MATALALQTKRLTLREFEATDWKAVHRYAADYRVVRYMKWGPNSEDESRDFVARAIAEQTAVPRTHHNFAITLAATGQVIGACGLVVRSAEERTGWIGYCLNRAFWRQGYGTEAARLLLAFGFDELGLHRVYATCDTENLASARILGKIGMIREGRLREHQQIKGRWRDSYLFAILDREWDRLQTGIIPPE